MLLLRMWKLSFLHCFVVFQRDSSGFAVPSKYIDVNVRFVTLNRCVSVNRPLGPHFDWLGAIGIFV